MMQQRDIGCFLAAHRDTTTITVVGVLDFPLARGDGIRFRMKSELRAKS